jgi:hypothetical protein
MFTTATLPLARGLSSGIAVRAGGEEAANGRMPKFIRLLPDEVARMCAHEAFLGGVPPRLSTSSLVL